MSVTETGVDWMTRLVAWMGSCWSSQGGDLERQNRENEKWIMEAVVFYLPLFTIIE